MKLEVRGRLAGLDSVSPTTSPLSQVTVATKVPAPQTLPTVGTTKYYDRVARDLRKRELGVGKTLDFGAAVRQAFRFFKGNRKPTTKRPADFPLPTEEEITVLRLLWRKGPSTSVELYASLDSTHLTRTTAERFWSSLHQMVKRGFLCEEIISPQQPMQIGIGPFTFSVEMSAKNRRNRIYRYEPLVDKETILTLLQSRQWLASKAGRKDKARRISRLLARVLQVAQTP